ncbi:hypothetical protein NHX12_025288 [Muraenolepis orangiensis]|uniref:G-protein coupled receptors family 1 profile domain-containing protein n=1 Tax=Muraenolepis orangiensis TaxID=630683 RepID=A0A9Q0EMJ1_9TELE|nr:hypothetical protein NHX12_025288 [Muraenolepis orangiensis]
MTSSVSLTVVDVLAAMELSLYDGNREQAYSGYSGYSGYSDYPSNGTSEGEEDAVLEICGPGEAEAEAIRGFQSFMFCLIFLLGVAGNGLVIATFALYRWRHLRSMTDIFLLHLALADLLLLLTLPLQGIDTHLGWVFSEPLCKVTRASYALNTYSGLMLLACISVDRYLAVAHPRVVLQRRGQLLVAGKLASLAVWLAALLLSVPEICYAGVSREGGDFHCVVKEERSKVKRISSVALIAVFGASSAVMVTCYSCVGRTLWAGEGKRRSRLGLRWQRQTLGLMAALVAVFLVFQLPYTVVLWHKMAAVAFCGVLLDYITCTLAYSRCCLNPILYALVGSRFRSDLRKLARHFRRPPVVQAWKSSSVSSPSSHPLLLLPPNPSYPGKSAG